MLFATPRSACLSVGLAALLVGVGVLLTGVSKDPSASTCGSDSQLYEPGAGQIGAAQVLGDVPAPGVLAWGPIAAGAILVAAAVLLPGRRPLPRRPRGS